MWIDSVAGFEAFLGPYEADVKNALTRMERDSLGYRLWRRDSTIWKSDPDHQILISNALGWLDVASKMEGNLRDLIDFAAAVRDAGFRHVVHMGMGGSSLAPLAFKEFFFENAKGLPLTVLDTTDPATVLSVERSVPIERTLFVEASKSGSTIESRSFGEYFYGKVKQAKGGRSGENFAVITDEGSTLAALAAERGYRRTFINYSDIGGRYSALSYFGLVPAALMGMDVFGLVDRAMVMMRRCGPKVPEAENPGVVLGAIMGVLSRAGRNKLTFLGPRGLRTLCLWLEQLIAESTGKEGQGILPVAGEPPGAPDVYGADRLFVQFRIESEPDTTMDGVVEELRRSGNPVVVIGMRDRLDLGAEFFRWEVATAVAGAFLRIDPFDQPDVQATKTLTVRFLNEVGETGRLPDREPAAAEKTLEFYADAVDSGAAELLGNFTGELGAGDYVGILAFLTESGSTDASLSHLAALIRDRFGVAVTVGYGPRYLHSTGQFHKGGPATGRFLVLTCEDGDDAPIPGKPYTFGVLRRAQALGDLEALGNKGRTTVRVHIRGNVPDGLSTLASLITGATRKAV